MDFHLLKSVFGDEIAQHLHDLHERIVALEERVEQLPPSTKKSDKAPDKNDKK